MAVRKSATEIVVVEGDREEWLRRTAAAMNAAGFRKITTDPTLFQVSGHLRRMTLAGSVAVTLLPDAHGTRLEMRATANADNVYAVFRSPTAALLNALKTALPTT